MVQNKASQIAASRITADNLSGIAFGKGRVVSDVHHKRVDVCRRRGCSYGARPLLVLCVKAVLWPLLVVAILFLVGGQPVRAEEDAEKFFDLGAESLRSGKYDEAIQAFTKAQKLLRPSDENYFAVTYHRALAHFKKGALESAWKDTNAIIQSGTASGEAIAQALLLRGQVYSAKGNDEKAKKDFTDALKAHHDSARVRAESWARRGAALIKLGRPADAVSDLDQAVKLEPNYANAYAVRALAFLRCDNPDAAKRDAERALRMNPDEEMANLAQNVLHTLAKSMSGPDRVTVAMSQEGHVFVHLRFGKRGKPHRFLLDTGATYSVVKPNMLKEIQQETEVTKIGRGRVALADGSLRTVTRYKVAAAFVENLPLGDMEVHVFDGKVGENIPNLLGMKSLKQLTVSMNNAARKAEIKLSQP